MSEDPESGPEDGGETPADGPDSGTDGPDRDLDDPDVDRGSDSGDDGAESEWEVGDRETESEQGSGEADRGANPESGDSDSGPEQSRQGAADEGPATSETAAGTGEPADDVPPDVRKYDRFQKVDRASYERVNDFLRDRTYVTAREWAIARLCADFRTGTGVEMTKIGENLPELVPFMTDTYSPQAVNQARSAFEEKVRKSGSTFLYGAMSGFFTADELDELMYEVTEVAKFLLEVEGVELAVEEELEAEDRISGVMREVRLASEDLRHDDVECPHCGGSFDVQATVDDGD